MSNMSYCRFQNTDNDLADCESVLEELFGDGIGRLTGREELEAAKRLAARCQSILLLITASKQDDEDVLEMDLGALIDAANDAAEA